jgi:hypothetical protein
VRTTDNKYASSGASRDMVPPDFLGQTEFLRVLHLEEKRAERSGMACGLMRIHAPELFAGAEGERFREELRRALRDTDLCGWYQNRETVGVIFIELQPESAQATSETLASELQARLRQALPDVQKLQISCSTFPRRNAMPRDERTEQTREPQVVGRR